MLFKLIAGIHYGPDYSQKPDKFGKYPTKKYNQGDTVEDKVDLVTKCGPEKFQFIGPSQIDKGVRSIMNLTPGDPTPENLVNSPSVAPAGQVSTGFQSTSTDQNTGKPVSGAASKQEIEKVAETRATAQTQQEKPQSQQSKTQSQQPKPQAHQSKAVPQKTVANLDKMTIGELTAFAEEEEIDLRGATKRDEILSVIKDTLSE